MDTTSGPRHRILFDQHVGVAPGAIAWIVATLIIVPPALGIAFARRIEPAIAKIADIALALAVL